MVREETNEEDILPASRRNPGFLPWLRVDPGIVGSYVNGHEFRFVFRHIISLIRD